MNANKFGYKDKMMIEGVILTPLKQIYHPKGDLFHGMKKSDPGFTDFGEAYFSTIHAGEIKPWKKHFRMTLNLIVPVGKIRFVIHDDRTESPTRDETMSIELGPENYKRLTVPPGLWMAFEGIGETLNLLLNVADLEHDPEEVERADPDRFVYPKKNK
ncbi:MAG: dTDP-4-dehydrorhamnose 3,5-epimerase [Bacteroidales bacterium]|nr:dTDP-4-dehydrorhamnose 3,5-epimerase family protein [Bacteroidales bacterium]